MPAKRRSTRLNTRSSSEDNQQDCVICHGFEDDQEFLQCLNCETIGENYQNENVYPATRNHSFNVPGRSFAHAQNLMHFCSDFILKKVKPFTRKDPSGGFCDARVVLGYKRIRKCGGHAQRISNLDMAKMPKVARTRASPLITG